MANLTFYQPATMLRPSVWFGTVTVATSTQLSLTNYTGSSATYFGNNLTYSGSTVTGGTVTGYDSYKNYSLDFTVRNANVDARTLANLTNAGSATQAQSFVLSGSDTFLGTNSSDTIIGYDGNDLIAGAGGTNDYIDGGNGIDWAVYGGQYSNYSISIGRTSTYVLDKVTNRDGADSLLNIERLSFTDIKLAIDIAPNQNAGSVYMLYKAAFNRAPDAGGMGYWLNQKDSGANIVTNIAQGFVSSAEFITKYGTNPNNASYVNNLYQNVLGRSGEAGGVAYWTAEMDAGRVSKAQALVQFATLPEGAQLVAPLIANGILFEMWAG